MMNGIPGISGYGFVASVGSEATSQDTVGVAMNTPDTAKVSGLGGSTPKADKVQNTGECETCKNRKYQDGSNENVSFKAATHISPEAAGSAVRAHEGEHVSNAYTKAAQNNGKVINASVAIHTSVCPECGRTYVSGGVTNTMIKYSNQDNPYMKNLKAQQQDAVLGKDVDIAVADA